MQMATFFMLCVDLVMSSQCFEDWEKIFKSQQNTSISHNYWLMYQYSGFTKNNLGNFEGCKTVHNSSFVVLTLFGHPATFQGLCGPNSCAKSDYLQNPSFFNHGYYANVEFPVKYQEENYKVYTLGASIMIYLIYFVSLIVLSATLLEIYIYKKNSTDSKTMKLAKSFSLISNTKLLFRTEEKLNEVVHLNILDAVRVISLWWVILGHVALCYVQLAPLLNYDRYEEFFERKEYILIYTGFYAVDSFFWMSGLLMSYFFLSKFAENSSVSLRSFLLLYLHRFIRITPVYMFCLCFFWLVMPYIGSGPLWYNISQRFHKDCDDYWYYHLLYANNFINWETSYCLTESWYLANDMQFFVISPIILLLHVKGRKLITWVILFSLVLLGIFSSYQIASSYKLNPSFLAVKTGLNYFHHYYTKPYCRVPSYVIGLACGMVLHSCKSSKGVKENQKSRTEDRLALKIGLLFDSKFKRILIFFSGLALLVFFILVQWDIYKESGYGNMFGNWTKLQKHAFIALERTGFALGLSMAILPMVLGYFKGISKWMRWSGWSVMARGSFAVYISHNSMMKIRYMSLNTSVEFTTYNIVHDWIWFFGLSFVCSLPIILGIEMPIMSLEKSFFINEDKRLKIYQQNKETLDDNSEVNEKENLS